MLAPVRRIVSLFIMTLLGSTAAHAVSLVQEGKPTATIVLADSALKAEAYKPLRGQSGTPDGKIKLAALDLQAYVEKMSGAKLPIASDAEETKGVVIWPQQAHVRDQGIDHPHGPDS
jgi:hypothetical protein